MFGGGRSERVVVELSAGAGRVVFISRVVVVCVVLGGNVLKVVGSCCLACGRGPLALRRVGLVVFLVDSLGSLDAAGCAILWLPPAEGLAGAVMPLFACARRLVRCCFWCLPGILILRCKVGLEVGCTPE